MEGLGPSMQLIVRMSTIYKKSYNIIPIIQMRKLSLTEIKGLV